MIRDLVLASAGAGKSRKIVDLALKKVEAGERVLILTYTEKNQEELRKSFCQLNGYVPGDVRVKGWFTFLLEDMIRPYQSYIFSDRIAGIHFNEADPHKLKNGRTIPGRKEKNGNTYNSIYYLTSKEHRAHTTYLSKLATRICKESKKKSAIRLAEIYGTVCIDEVQDLTGWDFEIIEALAKSTLAQVFCVGDFRQTLYTTHITRKKPETNPDKMASFEKFGMVKQELNQSWRCIQSICDFADLVYQDEGTYSPTESRVKHVDPEYHGHLGVFVVRPDQVQEYLDVFNPTILRTNKNTQKGICEGREVYNFGESKGMGFDRVLICATTKHKDFLAGNTTVFRKDKTAEAKNTLYVAITRAKYSVAFISDGDVKVDGANVWPGMGG